MLTLQDITGASCSTCCLWVDEAIETRLGKHLGQCRARAPIILQVAKGPTSRWPLTASGDWCAEHMIPSPTNELCSIVGG